MKEQQQQPKTTNELPDPNSSGKVMTKGEFWVRFAFWALFAAIIPVGFIIGRYGIFRDTAINTKLSGWGFLAIIIIAVFLFYIVRSARKGMDEGSMLVQCIDGFSLLIPLVALLLIIEAIKDNVEYFEQVLIVIIVCEAIAVPVNPMRKWASQNKIEKETNIVTALMKDVLGKKNKGDK